jgi:hypothetical protein
MWAQAVWPVQCELTGILTDITFLELFPVVVALNIWGYYLRNKKIIFHVDNQAVMYIINKKLSRSPRFMSLVRKLVFACLEFNILLKSEHIPGYLNSLADSLSRCDFQKSGDYVPQQTSILVPFHPIFGAFKRRGRLNYKIFDGFKFMENI